MCRASQTIAFNFVQMSFPDAPELFLRGIADLINTGISEMLRLTHARMMELEAERNYSVLANIQNTGNETWQATNDINIQVVKKYLGSNFGSLNSAMRSIIDDGIGYARNRAQTGIKELDRLGKLPDSLVALDLPGVMLFGLMMSQARHVGEDKQCFVGGQPILKVNDELFMWNDVLQGYWSVAGSVRLLSKSDYRTAS